MRCSTSSETILWKDSSFRTYTSFSQSLDGSSVTFSNKFDNRSRITTENTSVESVRSRILQLSLEDSKSQSIRTGKEFFETLKIVTNHINHIINNWSVNLSASTELHSYNKGILEQKIFLSKKLIREEIEKDVPTFPVPMQSLATRFEELVETQTAKIEKELAFIDEGLLFEFFRDYSRRFKKECSEMLLEYASHNSFLITNEEDVVISAFTGKWVCPAILTWESVDANLLLNLKSYYEGFVEYFGKICKVEASCIAI